MYDIEKEIIPFIQKFSSVSEEEIRRCINKACFLIARDKMVFVADNETIFFFMIDKSKRTTKDFKNFYDQCYPFMKGKYFFAKDIRNYKDRCELVENSQNNIFKKYKWL